MDPRIRAVIAYIAGHSHRRLSAGDLASLAQVSPAQLRRLFKTETGQSPLQYLREVRLQEAELLLRTTSLSVKEITARVGIADVSHFVRDFRKARGITPTAYRVHCQMSIHARNRSRKK